MSIQEFNDLKPGDLVRNKSFYANGDILHIFNDIYTVLRTVIENDKTKLIYIKNKFIKNEMGFPMEQFDVIVPGFVKSESSKYEPNQDKSWPESPLNHQSNPGPAPVAKSMSSTPSVESAAKAQVTERIYLHDTSNQTAYKEFSRKAAPQTEEGSKHYFNVDLLKARIETLKVDDLKRFHLIWLKWLINSILTTYQKKWIASGLELFSIDLHQCTEMVGKEDSFSLKLVVSPRGTAKIEILTLNILRKPSLNGIDEDTTWLPLYTDFITLLTTDGIQKIYEKVVTQMRSKPGATGQFHQYPMTPDESFNLPSMICNGCKELKPIENHELQLCPTCNKKRREAQSDETLYKQVRLSFLNMCIKNGVSCPITGRPITLDSDIHHKRGRIGFADQWARDNDISLRIDVRHFLAVTREGHDWIETHPDEARKKGYSEARSEELKLASEIEFFLNGGTI